MSTDELFLLAINLTRRCNLACAHCYLDAETLQYGGEGELTTAEVCRLLDEVAGQGNAPMVVLTGGEPLLRRDLEDLVRYGKGLGLSMVVGTNGTLLTERRVLALKAAGAMGLGISLDSLDPARHDRFRGLPGSWEKTLAGMEHCRRHDLPFQVHFSVTEENADEVDAMIDFARGVGARVLNVFFLVCTGRGEKMSDITPARYEKVLRQLVAAQDKNGDMIVRARCAPHFKRVAYQRDAASPLTRAEGYEGGGCLAGRHYCRITPEGAVTACPYIEQEEGSIRNGSFAAIWRDSPTFARLRSGPLTGKCGRCEFQQLCGGCRARPLAQGADLMGTDVWCDYRPTGGEIIRPLQQRTDLSVSWTAEAEQRLARVPSFLRKMVKKRAEAHATELGAAEVTVEHMSTLAKRRFGDAMPAHPGMPAQPDTAVEAKNEGLAWTAEARRHLESLPPFLQDGVRQVAEDVARAEGRLEVNMKLLTRLEEDDDPQRKLAWEPDAETALLELLGDRGPQIQLFVQPTVEAAAEREAKLRTPKGSTAVVTAEDVVKVVATQTAGVVWSAEALRRVESAPDFVRGGIKKAAEFNARREGLCEIGSEDLTRFRNRAMMRAVKRMKQFGLKDLSFDAYAVAQKRVPRLQENPQADARFAEIRHYVEDQKDAHGGPIGLLDRTLLEQMKAELRGEPAATPSEEPTP